MKTLDRPLDDDDQAMADLAEVTDWTKIAAADPDLTGPALVIPLIERVSAQTGWLPWPVDNRSPIEDVMDGWGFLTRRKTEMAVYSDLVLPHSPWSGWAAYDIQPDDVSAAEAGLDEHWPVKFELARKHWGEPDYVGTDRNRGFVNEWSPASGFDRRHLAVWRRAGAEFHLYSNRPAKDPLSASVGINYAVYLQESA